MVMHLKRSGKSAVLGCLLNMCLKMDEACRVTASKGVARQEGKDGCNLLRTLWSWLMKYSSQAKFYLVHPQLLSDGT